MVLIEDRYWRRGLLVVPFALATLAAFSYWYLRWALPLDELLQRPLVPDAIIAASVALSLLVFAFGALQSISRARARMALRRAAMEGNPEAMPRAQLPLPPVDSALAAAPAIPPEQLIERTRTAWPFIILFPIMLAVLVAFAGILISQFLLPALLLPIHAAHEHVNPAHSAFPRLVGPVAAFGVCVWIMVIMALALILNFALPTSELRLTDDGIRRRRVFGGERLIPWREMRLLEVTTGHIGDRQNGPEHPTHIFTLHAGGELLIWSELTDMQGALSARTRTWLGLLRRYAGLEPRTLDRSLLPPDAHSLRSSNGLPTPFLVMVIAAGDCFVAGITALSADHPIALWLFMMGGMLLILPTTFLYGLVLTWRRRNQSPIALAESAVARPAPSPPPPEPLAPGEVYEHAYYNEQHPKAVRITWAVLGVMYACITLFAITVVTLTCHSDAQNAACPVHDAGSWLGFLGFVAFWAVPSVPMLSLGFAGKPAAWIHLRCMVVADADGVHAPIWPRWRRTIPWNEVATVDLVHIWGKGWRYRVISTSGRKIIAWPLQKRPRPAPITTPPATPLDADAFAELVAARSGRRLDTSMRREPSHQQ